jgi:acyl dehydratase
MHKRYFDEFAVGEVFVSEGITLTEGQMVEFSLMYDPQPIHVDREAAKAGLHGDLIASGLQTLGLTNRLWVSMGLMGDNNLGGPGIDDVRWHIPVRAGDTLRVKTEILAARPSNSKPDRGILTMGFTTLNQRDEVVMSYQCVDILKRDPDRVD